MIFLQSLFLAVFTALRIVATVAVGLTTTDVAGGGEILTIDDGIRLEDGSVEWRPPECPRYLCLPGGPEDWPRIDYDGCTGSTSALYQEETGCIPWQEVTAEQVALIPTEPALAPAEAVCNCPCEETQIEAEATVEEVAVVEVPEEVDVILEPDEEPVDYDNFEDARTAPVIRWTLFGVVGINYSMANGFLLGAGPGIRMAYQELYMQGLVLVGVDWIMRADRFPDEENGNWLGAGLDFDIGIRFTEEFSAFLGYHTFTDAGAFARHTLDDGVHQISPGMRSYDANGVIGVLLRFDNYFIGLDGGPGINQFLHRDIESSWMIDFRLGMDFSSWVTGEEDGEDDIEEE